MLIRGKPGLILQAHNNRNEYNAKIKIHVIMRIGLGGYIIAELYGD